MERPGAEEAPVSRKAPAYEPLPFVVRPSGLVIPYAELHAHSHFSFLDGASASERLVEEAVRLGLDGLALTDHDGFYGAPMFAEAGAELSVGLPGPQAGVADPEGDHLLVLAGGLSGYRRLAGVLTEGHLAGGEKNRPRFDLEDLEDLAAAGAGEWTVLTGCRKGIVRRALAESDPDARLAAAMAAVRAPPEPAEGGHTPDSYLAELARQGGWWIGCIWTRLRMRRRGCGWGKSWN